MTTFAAMPPGVRGRWLDWANAHDWGGGRPARFDPVTSEMVTYGAETTNGRDWYTVEARHKTPSQMRAWAGY